MNSYDSYRIYNEPSIPRDAIQPFSIMCLDYGPLETRLSELGLSPQAAYGFSEGEDISSALIVDSSLNGFNSACYFIDVRTSNNKGSTVFNTLLDRAKQDFDIELIMAFWNSQEYTSNWDTFVKLVDSGLSPENASLDTFTGKMASRRGYSVPVVDLYTDSLTGNYSSAKVLFLKEDSPLLDIFLNSFGTK